MVDGSHDRARKQPRNRSHKQNLHFGFWNFYQNAKMEDDEEIAAEHGPSSRREALKRLKRRQIISRDEERAKLKTVRRILKKNLADRDPEELKFLDRYSKLANEVLKKNEKKIILQDRLKEVRMLQRRYKISCFD